MRTATSYDQILLSHGGGGLLTRELISEVIVQKLGNPILNSLGDSAICGLPERRATFTTDSFVVKPLFFPGGDIGRLAVCGTVNDLAVAGSEPMYLSLSFILEEGLPFETLERVLDSIADAAREAGVYIVTGDTKVVEKGAADGLYINTAGLGYLPAGRDLHPRFMQPGDAILVNGTLGDHGIAVMSEREGIKFQTELKSDVAPLNTLINQAFETGARIRCMRDATRGGLGGVVNEFALTSKYGIVLEDYLIPVKPAVRGACEMLGLDPLFVANEGKCVLVCAAEDANTILTAWREHPLGVNAARIGTVTEGPARRVVLKTRLGGERLLDLPAGEELPRIC